MLLRSKELRRPLGIYEAQEATLPRCCWTHMLVVASNNRGCERHVPLSECSELTLMYHSFTELYLESCQHAHTYTVPGTQAWVVF